MNKNIQGDFRICISVPLNLMAQQAQMIAEVYLNVQTAVKGNFRT